VEAIKGVWIVRKSTEGRSSDSDEMRVTEAEAATAGEA
jgi:hypothetical protein